MELGCCALLYGPIVLLPYFRRPIILPVKRNRVRINLVLSRVFFQQADIAFRNQRYVSQTQFLANRQDRFVGWTFNLDIVPKIGQPIHVDVAAIQFPAPPLLFKIQQRQETESAE